MMPSKKYDQILKLMALLMKTLSGFPCNIKHAEADYEKQQTTQLTCLNDV
jgi:hypothetical protein